MDSDRQVDPVDANTIYSESQYGVLVRYDKPTGQEMVLQPQEGKGEPAAAVELGFAGDYFSPHSHTRLYFAANKLFRSDDRGDTWKAISGDLTRQIDRNKLPVMGKVWESGCGGEESVDVVLRKHCGAGGVAEKRGADLCGDG